MNILVSKNGGQLGPFTREEVLARLQSGEVLTTDLGWYEGLPTWVPLGHFMGGVAAEPGSGMPPPPLPVMASPVPERVASGYAGFWLRAVALIMDGAVLAIPVALLSRPMEMTMFQFNTQAYAHTEVWQQHSMHYNYNGNGMLLTWLYFACLESSKLQGSLGKLAVGIYVTDENGRRLGFGRATGRHFAKVLSGMVLGIGFLLAAFTARKQAMHDLIAGCLVVRK